MKAARKIRDNKKLESKLDYQKVWSCICLIFPSIKYKNIQKQLNAHKVTKYWNLEFYHFTGCPSSFENLTNAPNLL